MVERSITGIIPKYSISQVRWQSTPLPRGDSPNTKERYCSWSLAAEVAAGCTRFDKHRGTHDSATLLSGWLGDMASTSTASPPEAPVWAQHRICKPNQRPAYTGSK